MMTRTELCAWLRANSSGIYRPAADAADEIEQLAAAKEQHFAQAMTNGAKAREYRDEADALRKDAERCRWLRARMLGADFDWGGAQVLVFEMPAGFSVSADFDATIDEAMAESPAVGAA